MKKMTVIIKKDLKEILHTKASYVSLGLALFVTIWLGAEIGKSIDGMVKGGMSPTDLISTIQSLIGSTTCLLAFMLMLLFWMSMNSYMVIMEKVKRSIESLLCTPLSLKQIWLAKSLAMFLPSVVLGLVFTFGGVIAINSLFIAPEVGHFVMPGAAPLVASLVVVPLIVFFLACVMTQLQFLIANIRWVGIAFMTLIFGVGFGIGPNLRMGPSSWLPVLISLGVAAALALLVAYLSSRLTKERIILSSKA